MRTASPSADRGLDVLLSRLDGVQRAGAGYRARCPACGGRSRKVSIIEEDDGRILVHCFGGCPAVALTQAVGLTLTDLFPARLPTNTPEARRAMRRAWRESQWGAALDVLTVEAFVVLIAARQVGAGQSLAESDGRRLAIATERIEQAQEVLRAR